MPLDGQEVVFEVGGETKIEQESEEGMQMIALIEGEGGVMGEGAGCSRTSGAPGGGAMEGIFQLEGGDEIVIIEVSTSNLIEGRVERGADGEMSQSSDVKYDGGAEESKEKSAKEHNSTEAQADDTVINGPIPKRCSSRTN